MAMQAPHLRGFVDAVYRNMSHTVAERCADATQVALIDELTQTFRGLARDTLAGDAFGLFYRLLRAAGSDDLSTVQVRAATACGFYLMGSSLLDDVQHDLLSSTAIARVGSELAINTGLTCMALVHQAIFDLMNSSHDRERGLRYFQAFADATWWAAQGQHRDLSTKRDPSVVDSPEEALEVMVQRGSGIILLFQFAALAGGASASLLPLYRRAGADASILMQIVADCRNVFGRQDASDLKNGRISYPVACYLKAGGADAAARLAELRPLLPQSLGEIRRMLYESGAVKLAAAQVEWHRRSLHRTMAQVSTALEIAGGRSGHRPHLRALLQMFDALAATLYPLPLVPETEAIMRPQTDWGSRLSAYANDFRHRMQRFGPPAVPPMVPKPRAAFRYHNAENCIYYPDLDELAEDVLASGGPGGRESDTQLRRLIERAAPSLIVHEMFHCWRDVSGNTTQDAWYEELVVGSLTVAYLKEQLPATLQTYRELAGWSLSFGLAHLQSPKAARVLQMRLESARPSSSPRGYGMGTATVAVVQHAMALRLIDDPDTQPLSKLVERYLAPGATANVWR